jgi:hypothetical protein
MRKPKKYKKQICLWCGQISYGTYVRAYDKGGDRHCWICWKCYDRLGGYRIDGNNNLNLDTDLNGSR